MGDVMTEIEALEFGREAVGCAAWRWLPGMRTMEELQPAPWTLPKWDAAIVTNADRDEVPRVCTVLGKRRDLHDGAVPDFRDPCTAGGLLALAREAWGDPAAYTVRDESGRWHVARRDGCYVWESDTIVSGDDGHDNEPAALVSALRAAPVATR